MPNPSPYAKPGPYITSLNPAEQFGFQKWVQLYKVPYDPSPTADYDMPGFWKAMTAGNPMAVQAASNGHFPDYWKTPYHATFSNESQYATPDAPGWLKAGRGYKLVDQKTGNVIADESQ